MAEVIRMNKRESNFDVSLPLSVNADHQEVAVFHGDPLGSYTGRGENPCETPVQDADDL